ncbi:AraC family transcriptional regulator ligand-binding domain-containing protein [Psychrobium sp. nBUS_13]|uniref:AraC family transcriptional regulator n=1 Tax=Psychrobium sp. nBUS_13 TaxID=3395319 RepID=UPI003EBBE637
MKNSTSISYFSGVLTFLEQQGVNREDALNAINFTEFDSYDDSQRVSLSHYSDLLDYGKVACDNPLFGCYLGTDIHSADYGVLGFLIESCENLGNAINDLLKFDRIVANIGNCVFSHNLEQASIAWTPHNQCSEQVVLRNMAAWCTTTTQLIGYTLPPTSVSFVHCYPKELLVKLSKLFNCPVYGGAKVNKIDFPFEFLNLEFRNDNPQIHQALMALSQEQLSKLNDNDLAKNRVADLLSTKIDLNNCTLIRFAAALHLSPRTLQRQLKAEQQQFGELLDSERQRRVIALIGKMPLGDLSQQLGFNEQSSLNRAFKRWFNCTPKQYLVKQDAGKRAAL